MFRLDRKLVISASIVTAVALSVIGCVEGDVTPPASSVLNNHPTIDGGVYNPVENGRTGPYRINEDTLKGGFNNGRVPTANEIVAWDKDVMPDGTGLPEGSGSVEEGEAVYEAQCVSCHGDFGSGGGGYPALAKGNAVKQQLTLKNQRVKPDADGPVRVFGSYWPVASTLWWYIRDGMPHTRSKTLSDDQVYALSAYILYLNEMEIDGQPVDDEYVLDREKFLKIKMPNVDGFEPIISGPQALENVRTYYTDAQNFGAQNLNQGAVRCMTDCQKETAKVVYIQNGGISDLQPPLSSVRDLPEEQAAVADPAKAAYEENCAACHADSSMGAPVVGSKSDWTKVLAKGKDQVYSNGINGINVMPPKGGTNLSDKEFKSIVDYMINASK
jgi:cytochrome c